MSDFIRDSKVFARKIYLVGNPNTGKTSLFNALTGETRRVGNWPGVTVERIEGFATKGDLKLHFIDLPGTYSLSPATPEEAIVLSALDDAAVSTILNIVDVANLERNLFLTLQLFELGLKPIIILNCIDELERNGGRILKSELERITGCTVYLTTARTREGVDSLLEALYLPDESQSTPLSKEVCLSERWLDAVKKALSLKGIIWQTAHVHDKFVALQALITPNGMEDNPGIADVREKFLCEIEREEKCTYANGQLACVLASDRYRRIARIVSRSLVISRNSAGNVQNRLDALLTNKWLGFPLFFLMMGMVFWTTYSFGEIPAGYIRSSIEWLKSEAWMLMPEGFLREMTVQGILPGIGGVLVFLPNILILFFWLAVLEDSGYMARSAFLMDRLMVGIGLNGRAFLPLMMGFGCNVPGIMATRIIEDRTTRLLTIFLLPMVGCSARLPVIVLLCGIFFPNRPGLWLFLLFFVNLLFLICIARFCRSLFFENRRSFFLLEMPPYRIPGWRNVFAALREKTLHFIEKAGSVILFGSILIWGLTAFPRDVKLSRDYAQEISLLRKLPITETTTRKIHDLNSSRDQETISGRYIGIMGSYLHPLVKPLGFGWREAVSLIPGFLAKESIVSTLNILYAATSKDIGDAMHREGMNPLKAFSFLLFTLLYVPCLPTIGVISRETASWKFTAVAFFVPGMLAWILCFMVYQIGLLFF